jgi:hypothetical protein
METIMDVGASLPQLTEEFSACSAASASAGERESCSRIAADARVISERVLKACQPLQVSGEFAVLKRKMEAALGALSDAFEMYATRAPGAQPAALSKWRPLWKAAMDELDATESRYTAAVRDGRCGR